MIYFKYRIFLTFVIGIIIFSCKPAITPYDGETNIVEPFEITAVTLLEGPFQHATELNKTSLLQFDPDRLLARFRKEAGLIPKAEAYGGWEGMSLAGHSLGHHLSACALMYQTSGDEAFKTRADYIVSELAEIQKANGGQYLGAFENGRKVFEEEVAQGKIKTQSFDLNGIWAPFYTYHKVMAGLRDAYRLLENKQALEVSKNFAHWIGVIVLPLNNEQVQNMLNCEFGGIQETLVDLYEDTNEEKYLEIAKVFHHEAVLDPLSNEKDVLPGIHGNTQIPKLIAAARLYETTGNETYKKASEFFWKTVVDHHSYVTGGHGNHEYFGQPDKLKHRLSDETTETCNVYNMLKLTRHLFLWNPRPEVGDYYERALYNHILSSQHPETGKVIYNLSLEMGGYKLYQEPDWFTCCVGTGMETHSKYGANIYYHNVDEIYINQFIASQLNWRDKGVELTQTTSFPERQGTKIEVSMDGEKEFSMVFRNPYWAEKGMKISINGKSHRIKATPGNFMKITRTWRNGDLVEIELPFSLRIESMPDDENRIAIFYGPIVLAGDLGAVEDENAADYDYVPVLMSEDRSPEKWLIPVTGLINTFKTTGIGNPRDIEFKPFYKIHDRRYSVYFDLYTQQDYAAYIAKLKIQKEKNRLLEEVTIDAIYPGDSISEIDHNFKGHLLNRMEDFKGRTARGSERGGWLSFELAMNPYTETDLVIEYWGGFTGSKTFDIIVNGVKIATENISGKQDGEFLNVTYPLPAKDVTNEKILVRFDPHAGSRSGPFFCARTVPRSSNPIN